MSTLEVTSFSRYLLSEQESISGSILNSQQKMVIQNIIADIAEEKLALIFDPTNPSRFMQQEADLAGKLSILKFILENSKAYEDLALQKVRDQLDEQNSQNSE